MVKPVFRVALRYPACGGLNNSFHGLTGAGLVGVLPALGLGIAAALGQVGAGLIHEPETGNSFALQDFDKGRSQAPHAGGVALGGMDALFFAASPALSGT